MLLQSPMSTFSSTPTSRQCTNVSIWIKQHGTRPRHHTTLPTPSIGQHTSIPKKTFTQISHAPLAIRYLYFTCLYNARNLSTFNQSRTLCKTSIKIKQSYDTVFKLHTISTSPCLRQNHHHASQNFIYRPCIYGLLPHTNTKHQMHSAVHLYRTVYIYLIRVNQTDKLFVSEIFSVCF